MEAVTRIVALRGGGLALAMLVSAGPLSAQLLSPGPLAEPHSELEGIRRCTACHALGTRGIQPERCLECHEAIDERVRADRGYHATVGSACADCHKEHLGRAFDVRRLDETTFDHSATGYELRLGHVGVDCRSCHRPERVVDRTLAADEQTTLERTFLGLAGECAVCHADTNPHGDQLGRRSCATCHDEATWTDAPGFDHASAAYTLDGQHSLVACADCHATGANGDTVYRPTASGSCATCHDDPHRGVMGGACASCHSTSGWGALASMDLSGRFDHGRTAFPLRGAHERADCVACHRPGRPPSGELIQMTYRPETADHSYPRPRADGCGSCHVDRHAFPNGRGRWAACASCHSEEAWKPSGFGAARHDAESTFPLDGAHAAVPCVLCHVDPPDSGRLTLALEADACRSCHLEDSPHDSRYDALACATCHVVESFDLVAFDHDVSGGLGTSESCAGCHGPDDPHAEQFAGRDCGACHGTESFAVDSFDHARTRFALEGAHEAAPCEACHVAEQRAGGSFVRYAPLHADCADCHRGEP